MIKKQDTVAKAPQSVPKPKVELDRSRLVREKSKVERELPPRTPPPVSAGPIDKVLELAFNASRDKIREVTSIDRVQGRLLPQLDIIDLMWQHVIEIATFRQDSGEYEKVYEQKRPVPPNLIEEFTYRTAQWQKSIAGLNLKSAVDLALAEMETKAEEEEGVLGGHGFDEA